MDPAEPARRAARGRRWRKLRDQLLALVDPDVQTGKEARGRRDLVAKSPAAGAT
jgi:hypothetical protein